MWGRQGASRRAAGQDVDRRRRVRPRWPAPRPASPRAAGALEARATTVLPVTTAGATTETSRAGSRPRAQRRRPRRSARAWKVEVRARHRVGGAADLGDLVGQPAYQTHRSMAASTTASAAGHSGPRPTRPRPRTGHAGPRAARRPGKHLAAVLGGRRRPAGERLAGGDHRVPGVLADASAALARNPPWWSVTTWPAALRAGKGPADVQLVRLAGDGQVGRQSPFAGGHRGALGVRPPGEARRQTSR